MKKFIPAVSVTIFAALLVVPLSGCFGGPKEEPFTLVSKDAKNVEKVIVHDKAAIQEVIVFDIERDGVTLTCTTKMAYTAGVSCIEKPKQ